MRVSASKPPDAEIRIFLQRTANPKTHKEMHIDPEADDIEEVRRLETLGAVRYDHQRERGYDFWVMRDPWQNEFCVLDVNFPAAAAAPSAGHSQLRNEPSYLARGKATNGGWRPSPSTLARS